MPVIPFIPLIAAGVGTAGSVYAGHKAGEAAKLDPTTQAMQNEALQLQRKRAQMFDPVLQMLTTQAQNRLPASSQGGMGAPSMAQLRSPYAGQALSQLAQQVPAPGRRMRYSEQS